MYDSVAIRKVIENPWFSLEFTLYDYSKTRDDNTSGLEWWPSTIKGKYDDMWRAYGNVNFHWFKYYGVFQYCFYKGKKRKLPPEEQAEKEALALEIVKKIVQERNDAKS